MVSYVGYYAFFCKEMNRLEKSENYAIIGYI